MPTKLPSNVIALLYGFLAVAKTLNISHAAETLKISRATLQNRLKELENLCGYQLLEFDSHNRYKLTAQAESFLKEVRIWLRQGDDIFSRNQAIPKGLLHYSPQNPDETFYCQQHPLSSVWKHNTPYLQSAMKAWLKFKGRFDGPDFSYIRNNAILARLYEDKFIITEIGKDAAMNDWLGTEWCLSAIGNPLSSTPMSSKADQIITYTYHQAIIQGSPWYDHISAVLPRPEKGAEEQAYYRRIIFPCQLPDGSPLIASVVEITDDLVMGDL